METPAREEVSSDILEGGACFLQISVSLSATRSSSQTCLAAARSTLEDSTRSHLYLCRNSPPAERLPSLRCVPEMSTRPASCSSFYTPHRNNSRLRLNLAPDTCSLLRRSHLAAGSSRWHDRSHLSAPSQRVLIKRMPRQCIRVDDVVAAVIQLRPANESPLGPFRRSDWFDSNFNKLSPPTQ